MADDNRTDEFSGDADDDLLFDDLDFGDNDEDLLSALQPKRKSERTLDVTEFFVGLEDEVEDSEDGEAPEGTIVLSSLEAAALDLSGDEPETTVLGSADDAPETTVLGSADDAPETTVLGSADDEPETTVLASGEAPSEPAGTDNTSESTSTSGALADAEPTTAQATSAVPAAPTPPARPAAPATPSAPSAPAAPPQSSEPISSPTSSLSGIDASGAIDVSGALAAIGTSGAAAERPAATEHAPVATSDSPAEGGGHKPLIIALIAAAVIAIAGIAIFVIGTSSSSSSNEPSSPAGQAQQTASSSSSEAESEAESDAKTYSLVVEYRDAQTNKMLQSSREEDFTEDDFPDSVTSKTISGYEVIGGTDNGYEFFTADDRAKNKDAKVTIDSKEPSNHRIVYTYAKQVSYTVRYLENGTDAELSPPETTGGKLSGESVTAHSKDIDGYNLTGEPEITITLNNDEGLNVITFRYDKKPEEPAPAAQPAQSTPTYNYTPPTYTPPVTTPTPSAPADDAVDGSW